MTKKQGNTKPWGGRFNAPTNEFVEDFTASIAFDQRMALCDIRGSLAHAQMLKECNVISDQEGALIEEGLKAIQERILKNDFEWHISLEDVHMNIEHALVESIGTVGKKLHTARSRNDQVATDMKLYLRGEIDSLLDKLKELLTAIVDLAEREASTLMPGYTHLQAAQPITFGHHLLAWFEMVLRDADRMKDCRKRLNTLPLGAGALAGTTFPINRERVAELLDFDSLAENSIDAVSDRDFAIEFSAAASLLMVHYSRISEELVLWNSQAFGFIAIDDTFCTGSSMMPQKKNPDVPELIRGKSGRVIGALVNLLTIMKAQPLAYNKDNQEDKEPTFDAIDTVQNATRALSELIPNIIINRSRMREAASFGFITATDLADHLVREGLPFRDAHAVVGQAVQLAIAKGCGLEQLSLENYQDIDSRISQTVFEVLNMDKVIDERQHRGATAPRRVREACAEARKRLNI